MISVDDALAKLLALVSPLEAETVPLRAAAGRVLAREVRARRTQPPFDASSMDGYALRRNDLSPDARFDVIGEAAAGHGFDGSVGPGQSVRIFTGAPVPRGADMVVIQEDVTRDGDRIAISGKLDGKSNIRPAGSDFHEGDSLSAPRRLTPSDVALLAAMNIAEVPVARKPVIALLATGDELVLPGEAPGPDQIIASNSFGLAALLEELGATARLLPVARDTSASLAAAFALAEGADLLVTIGGASVGDHDLVGGVAAELGMKQSFYKVAMRPGKPLMAGNLKGLPMLGLPGNPVSAMVCGTVFLAPMVRVMQGFAPEAAPRTTGALAQDIPANGPREHYMRARLGPDGLSVFGSQDSSLLTVLSEADALLVRPPGDPARVSGDTVDVIMLRNY
ncbi:molybdopterin molybdotransferase MoeA [Sulfitobacter sp. D35]|uniref:molybdopterin molybdotransferase MoeA n=1 Tax=Sulfitobacter sp. D35 TaxID=3083252 RepID=UPI00296FC8DE|nr:gephyrin-like molybdotransferase Glp [Sulfitobacter sp. D35]MDW4497537.1 molybdopterin molybdotransferase MoeA [Sulfitobacter sp. D35]